MNKKYHRYFGGFLSAQEKWLNMMSSKGLRLIKTGKTLYEFEECPNGKYCYRIDFIGEKSKEKSEEYYRFLEDMGYKVFYKNLNLNYSVGKAIWRPWADKGGRIATDKTTLNRELLIIEKENDGKPFEIHSENDDKLKFYKNLQKPLISFFAVWCASGILSAANGIWTAAFIFGIIAVFAACPIVILQSEITKLNKIMKIKE